MCRQRLENLLEFDAINVTITDIRHTQTHTWKGTKKKSKMSVCAGWWCPLLWLSSHFKFSCICDAFRFWLRIREYESAGSQAPLPCIIQQNVCHTTLPTKTTTTATEYHRVQIQIQITPLWLLPTFDARTNLAIYYLSGWEASPQLQNSKNPNPISKVSGHIPILTIVDHHPQFKVHWK